MEGPCKDPEVGFKVPLLEMRVESDAHRGSLGKGRAAVPHGRSCRRGAQDEAVFTHLQRHIPADLHSRKLQNISDISVFRVNREPWSPSLGELIKRQKTLPPSSYVLLTLFSPHGHGNILPESRGVCLSPINQPRNGTVDHHCCF